MHKQTHLHKYGRGEPNEDDGEHEEDTDGAPVRLGKPKPDEGVEDGGRKDEEDGGGVVAGEALVPQHQSQPEVHYELGRHQTDVQEQRDAAVDHHLRAEGGEQIIA